MIAAVRTGASHGRRFAGRSARSIALPGFFPAVPHPTNADAAKLYEAARPLYVKRLAAERQRLLYATPWPPSGLWAKKPVRTPADLAGLAIRSYDATGTKCSPRPGRRRSTSPSPTDAGLADGSVVAYCHRRWRRGRKLWDYLPHFTEINYAVPLSLAIVSDAAYTELPAELRTPLIVPPLRPRHISGQLLEGRLAENYARMAENGVTIPRSTPDAGVARPAGKECGRGADLWRARSVRGSVSACGSPLTPDDRADR